MQIHVDPRTVPSGTGINKPGEKKNDPEILKQRCQDFEALYIQAMYKAMRNTVIDGGLFAKSNAEEMYRDMLDGELAAQTAREQSFGLAQKMYEQIAHKLGLEQSEE
ncbi:MAG: rod-binding protein [Desulfobulbaceae bacterium]|nr:rod-binding protein [Desulfobulbaceae bacterium]